MGGSPQGILFRSSSGFSSDPHCERMTVELNPASWPPLCSCYFFPWFLSVALQIRLADVVCTLHSLHLYFPLPRAGFLLWLVGALLIATKDPQCCALLFAYKYRKMSVLFGSALRLAFDIFLLYCVIMLIQMYANTLWVWILMFLYSCSACVCSPRC